MESLEIIPEIPDAVVPTDESAETSPAGMQPDIDRLIAEAEQRGYLRGRNERIEAEIMTPADPYFGPPVASQPDDDDDDESCPGFLAHLRPGFWD